MENTASRPASPAGIASVLALILLLTHPGLSFEGAGRGLLLWSETVLPTLLPFMICSNVIVAAGGLPYLMRPLRPLVRNLLRLSDDGGYVLISGLLCGCPMGARTCAEFLAQGRITPAEARYLLAISNHPSPMFVLGYLASNLGPEVPVWLIPASLYLPVIPIAGLARIVYRPGCAKPPQSRRGTDSGSFDFDSLMMRSVEVMVRIGGYIMLFSILASFIEQLPGGTSPFKAVLLGVAEITTGIRAIARSVNGPLRGLCLTAVTAFGGLSGAAQTRSVLRPYGTLPSQTAAGGGFRGSRQMDTQTCPLGSLPSQTAASGGFRGSRRMDTQACPHGSLPAKNAGLSIRHYVMWKLLHTLTACLLYILLRRLPALPLLRLFP